MTEVVQKTGEYFPEIPVRDFLYCDDGRFQRLKPEEFRRFSAARADADTLLPKLGTSVVVHENPQDTAYNMGCFSQEVRRAIESGLNVLVISSGALGFGRMEKLGTLDVDESKETPEQQLQYARIGQEKLFDLWNSAMQREGLSVQPYLVTQEEAADGMRNLGRIFELCNSEGKVVIANEHDVDTLTRGIEEHKKKFSDNDIMSAIAAIALKNAGYNIRGLNMSNVEGIYTRDEFLRKGVPMRIINGTANLEKEASQSKSHGGKGGVLSKIYAVRMFRDANIAMTVANGKYCEHGEGYNPVGAVLDSSVVGTLVLPRNFVPTAKLNGYHIDA